MFGRSLAGLIQFAQRVVRRVLVDVAQGRIVEDRVDEEIDVAAEAQAGQSDVNQLAGGSPMTCTPRSLPLGTRRSF